MRTPHPVSAAEILDLRRLREIRRGKGLTLDAVGRAIGLSGGRYGAFERGADYMRLWHFRQVCIVLNLDPLEICEILRHPVINRRDMEHFRAACRRLGTTPAQALADFLKVFIKEAKRNSANLPDSTDP